MVKQVPLAPDSTAQSDSSGSYIPTNLFPGSTEQTGTSDQDEHSVIKSFEKMLAED